MNQFIESSIWAIDSRYFGINRARIEKMIESGAVDVQLAEKTKATRPVMRFATVDPGLVNTLLGRAITFQTAVQFEAARAGGSVPKGAQRVAIVPISGPMSKNGGLCSYGTTDIIGWIDQANADADISSIVLAVDSPGGAVDGTERLAAVIKASSKPIVAFVDGMGASAAYWASSQASEIIISSETTAFAGSIGTLIQHVDQSAALEKEGRKVTFITADKSVDKVRGNGVEPLNDEAIAMFKAQLNAINDTFEAAVRAGRGEKLSEKEDVFTAKVYNGRDAKKAGLVDKIGTLDDAVRRSAQLAIQSNSNYNPNSNLNQDNMKFALAGFPLFGAALVALNLVPSADAEIGAEDTIKHAEAAIKAANDARAAVEQQLATALKEKTALEASHKTAIEGKNQEIATLEEWKKNAGASGATPPAGDELDKPVGGQAKQASWETAAAKYQSQLQGK